VAAINVIVKLMFLHKNVHSGGRGAPEAHLNACGSNRSMMMCGMRKLTNAATATQPAIRLVVDTHGENFV